MISRLPRDEESRIASRKKVSREAEAANAMVWRREWGLANQDQTAWEAVRRTWYEVESPAREDEKSKQWCLRRIICMIGFRLHCKLCGVWCERQENFWISLQVDTLLSEVADGLFYLPVSILLCHYIHKNHLWQTFVPSILRSAEDICTSAPGAYIRYQRSWPTLL